jgi:hypothetical protein
MHCIYLTLSRFNCRFTTATGLRAAFEAGSTFFFWGELKIVRSQSRDWRCRSVNLHLQHVQIRLEGHGVVEGLCSFFGACFVGQSLRQFFVFLAQIERVERRIGLEHVNDARQQCSVHWRRSCRAAWFLRGCGEIERNFVTKCGTY